MSPAHVAFWQDVVRQAVATPVWQEELARLSWSAMHIDGDALADHLANETAEYADLLGELGLLLAPAGN